MRVSAYMTATAAAATVAAAMLTEPLTASGVNQHHQTPCSGLPAQNPYTCANRCLMHSWLLQQPFTNAPNLLPSAGGTAVALFASSPASICGSASGAAAEGQNSAALPKSTAYSLHQREMWFRVGLRRIWAPAASLPRRTTTSESPP